LSEFSAELAEEQRLADPAGAADDDDAAGAHERVVQFLQPTEVAARVIDETVRGHSFRLPALPGAEKCGSTARTTGAETKRGAAHPKHAGIIKRVRVLVVAEDVG
jgi:hypothetical protein